MKVKPLRIGITGGIASGKSETLEYLRKKNFPVICSDAIYHHLLNTRQALNRKIMTAFKLTSKNGTVDRKQLGAIVFSDKSKLQKLNSITHPHIIKEINLKIKALKNNPIIFIDIPLLFETGLESETDMIIT
nr:dephospho-CoA kinase [bacterium]